MINNVEVVSPNKIIIKTSKIVFLTRMPIAFFVVIGFLSLLFMSQTPITFKDIFLLLLIFSCLFYVFFRDFIYLKAIHLEIDGDYLLVNKKRYLRENLFNILVSDFRGGKFSQIMSYSVILVLRSGFFREKPLIIYKTKHEAVDVAEKIGAFLGLEVSMERESY